MNLRLPEIIFDLSKPKWIILESLIMSWLYLFENKSSTRLELDRSLAEQIISDIAPLSLPNSQSKFFFFFCKKEIFHNFQNFEIERRS